MKADVIKRSGKRTSEAFQTEKLHASIIAACLSVRSPEGEAEKIAQSVCKQIIEWLEQKPEVTSEDLRRKASDALSTLNPEAAYLYKHHQIVL
jgi:transcriptional regulator NrdR family protein